MSSPARLHKVEEKSTMAKIMECIDIFAMKYAHILLPIFIIILVLLLIVLAFAIVDISSAHNMVTVDSGNYYYHLKEVI